MLPIPPNVSSAAGLLALPELVTVLATLAIIEQCMMLPLQEIHRRHSDLPVASFVIAVLYHPRFMHMTMQGIFP